MLKLLLIGGVVAVAVVVLLLVLTLVWGILHMRASVRWAEQAIAGVTLSEIDGLKEECERVFTDAFGEELHLDDFEHTAWVLSNRLDDVDSLKRAFAKDNFYWYFVLPVGAYLGEFCIRHGGGEWKESEEGGLEIVTKVSEENVTAYPFEKVIKQATIGEKSDIYAYLKLTTRFQGVRDVGGEGV